MKYLMQKIVYLASILLLCLFPLYVYAQSPLLVTVYMDGILPVAERENKYDHPLGKALQEMGLGRVVGGESNTVKGSTKKVLTMTRLYVELYDKGKGIPFLKRKLQEIGAPPGTWVSYDLSREVTGNTISIQSTSEVAVPIQSPPRRIQPMTDEQARQIAVNTPDQFKTTCQCTEKDGWLALGRNNNKWHLSKFDMRVDQSSGFFEPVTIPVGTAYYFRIKGLKPGDVQTPSIAKVKDVSQEGEAALRFTLNPDFGKPIERKSNYFGEGENIEMTFHGERYKFSYTKDDYAIYLSTSNGLIRIGDGAPLGVTVDWVGDLNGDGKLDFILAEIENVPGVKDTLGWNLFLSSANGCYRVIPHLSYENYLIKRGGGVVPPPNPANRFCVGKEPGSK